MGLTAPATNLAVRVQHHPSRADIAARLTRELAPFNDVVVVPDPQPNAHRNAWRAHEACLRAMPKNATHLLVIQDDALPNENFHAELLNAIHERPESILLPFVPGFPHLRKEFRQAHAQGERFLRFYIRTFVPVVAIVYPAAVVHDLLSWVKVKNHVRGADDGIVAFYCRARRIAPAALVPCICDHDDTVKTIGAGARAGPHRRAALLGERRLMEDQIPGQTDIDEQIAASEEKVENESSAKSDDKTQFVSIEPAGEASSADR